MANVDIPVIEVKASDWDSLWLISKSFRDSRKFKQKIRVELTTGSLEIIIQVLQNISQNPLAASSAAAVVSSVVTYILMRKKKDKEVTITNLNGEAIRGLALHAHMIVRRLEFDRIISERKVEKKTIVTIADLKGRKYEYTINKDGYVYYPDKPSEEEKQRGSKYKKLDEF